MRRALVYGMLSIALLASLFPFFYMFVCATNDNAAIQAIPPSLVPGSMLAHNYSVLDEKVGVARVAFNSLVTALIYTSFTLLFHSMAGYALVKFKFRGRGLFWGMLLITMMLPQEMTYIPRFSLMNRIGWTNSYQALIFPALANSFGVFLMRQNFQAFPTSLIEQGRIDGSSEFGIFFRIALPNMKPALGALGIYMFMSNWNSFMWPLIILGTKDMYTFPVALAMLDGNPWRKEMGVIMLASAISILPILLIFLLFQKQFVAGVMGGAIKE
ncbi:MAG: carbohydrate ABC transporter permease [Clostridia bacterium]